MMNFAVEFRPMGDGELVKVNRTRLRDGRLHVAVAGELYNSGRLRPFLAMDQVFRNPIRDEIVAGGWGRYVMPTRGSRKGMIVHTNHVRGDENPAPVSSFHWLDELPEGDPMTAQALEMTQMAQELQPSPGIEWPKMYAAVNPKAYRTGIDEWGARRLQRVKSIPIDEIEDREQAIEDIRAVLGMSASLSSEMERAFWSTLRRIGDKLFAGIDYIQVPEKVDLFADLANVRLLQAVSRRHDLEHQALKGRAGKVTFCLVPQ